MISLLDLEDSRGICPIFRQTDISRDVPCRKLTLARKSVLSVRTCGRDVFMIGTLHGWRSGSTWWKEITKNLRPAARSHSLTTLRWILYICISWPGYQKAWHVTKDYVATLFMRLVVFAQWLFLVEAVYVSIIPMSSVCWFNRLHPYVCQGICMFGSLFPREWGNGMMINYSIVINSYYIDYSPIPCV